jgi:acetyltransferase-like isoleucine patch superfamily enzyme
MHFRLLLAGIVVRLLPHDMFNHVRTAIYRMAGLRIGYDSQFCGPLSILGWEGLQSMLSIGNDVALESPCTLVVAAPLRIGDGVRMGHDVMILTGTHRIGLPRHRCGPYEFKPVTIGDGVWIGARTVVLPGVSIGQGCVISAGTVVTRDMPANSLIAGNPARVVGQLTPDVAAPERV